MGLLKNVIGYEDEFTKMIRARDNGEVWAQEKLNELFKRNDPGLYAKIDNARISIYKKDAYKGDAKAQYYYGMAMQTKDKAESLRMLMPLAEKGNTDAMTAIAFGYTEYGGYGDNPGEYMRWHTMAAKAGVIDSQNTVALQYAIQQDWEQAFNWYSEAAKQGSASGYCGMGECYKNWKRQLYNDGNIPTHEKLFEYDQKILACYEEALQYLSSANEEIETLWGLGTSYHSASYDIDEPDQALLMRKLAIYYLYASYDVGQPHGLSSAQKIADENNILVNFNDIKGWAEAENLFTN